MLEPINLKYLAQKLRDAHLTKIPCSPLREIIGTTDIKTAYEIQEINNQRLIDNGAKITGHKIGLTSKAVQKQLGVDQPDFGVLFNTMEILNNDAISVKELMQAKAEAEVAFVLGKDLPDHEITSTQLLSAIEYALPAIEIVGSRIENWNIKITDTIADNASASHYVLGHQPTPLANIDLVNCQMEMKKNGTLVSQGSGAACLGSPINATLWLVNKMAKLGSPLKAGQVILSGALGPMAVIEAGDSFEASFSGLGKVYVHFTD